MSQAKDNNLAEQFIAGVLGLGWLLLFLLIGAFILAKWLTKLLFELVVNRLLNGALDRHDGLVVMLSGLLWSFVFTILYFWLLYPQLDYRTPEERVQAFGLFLGLGVLWGVAVAGWILLEWWSDSPPVETAYEPVQMLGEPVRLTIASTGGTALQPPPPSRNELEAEMEEIYGSATEKGSEPVTSNGTGVAVR